METERRDDIMNDDQKASLLGSTLFITVYCQECDEESQISVESAVAMGIPACIRAEYKYCPRCNGGKGFTDLLNTFDD